MPLSYILHSYYMLQENFSRAMAHTERTTGKSSSVVCILDLKGLNLVDFMNPLSGPAQLARLVVMVWAEYFSEHVSKRTLSLIGHSLSLPRFSLSLGLSLSDYSLKLGEDITR